MKKVKKVTEYAKRRRFLLGIYALCMLGLFVRTGYLQVWNQEFLKNHGDARALRVVKVPASRGAIVDRNGEPLAISTPVSSIWANPKKVAATKYPNLEVLAKYLQMDTQELMRILDNYSNKEFAYLKRRITPTLAQQVMALKIPGISTQKEYRRYYPTGEVTAHVLGFTNIDDAGQEGIELAYDDWLNGSAGSNKVLQDRLGQVIEHVESISMPDHGKDLVLSIDKRIQYLAYRELKQAVTEHKARAGVLVMLDAETGEVIAMVGQPSYNPHDRTGFKSVYYRNRALTDVFEPGSTIKPFTIASALDSGIYDLKTVINTNPGLLKVGEHTVRDHKNYGMLTLESIIKKSSNVGASKIALSLESAHLWKTLQDVGFGQVTTSGFPGEAAGYITPYNVWSDVQQAIMSFGYGISVTAVQLAQAYMAFAQDGIVVPVSFLKISKPSISKRVLPAHIAQQVRAMLETVVQEGGTGKKAAISGYRIAGKTGTVHKSTLGGYAKDRYVSLFVGLAPASRPKLIVVVMIDEPKTKEYYGGLVAAPVFKKVMSGSLRLLNIPPDNLVALNQKVIPMVGTKK